MTRLGIGTGRSCDDHARHRPVEAVVGCACFRVGGSGLARPVEAGGPDRLRSTTTGIVRVLLVLLATALPAAELRPGTRLVTFPGDLPGLGGVAVEVALGSEPASLVLRFRPGPDQAFAMAVPETGEVLEGPGPVAVAAGQAVEAAGPVVYPAPAEDQPVTAVVPLRLVEEPISDPLPVTLVVAYTVPGKATVVDRRITVPLPVSWLR